MTLSAGSRLGPYEVLGLLGAGGMGEVYRARDPRLGREVAVKVLPEAVARDADRLLRFEREARAVAALNHPNILTVFDVGTQPSGEGDATAPYVVTELLEGETLREHVSRHSASRQQVLSLAVQAAQGLDAAHAKGIVHRDLKPENLFVTTDGRVKILDFGLAKLVGQEAGASVEETESSPTGAGQVLGTVGYMSPEQVRALPVDHRTDIFSLGVVLYELLAGKHPFRRETAIGTLTAILEETPAELASLGRGIPPSLSGIVKRCLEKDRGQRFRSAHDLGLALESVLAAPTGSAALQETGERDPYPGLLSFTEEDAGLFFGREAEVGALWSRLRNRRLLAVIAPSGAGKTSLVRAGVVASRPEGWAALVCTPGSSPFRGLGQALAPELSGDPDALRKLVGFEDAETAYELVVRWRKAHAEALVVVDQFEELFTLNGAEAQGRFASLLGRLSKDGDVHVLLSMRDDFLIRCSEQEALSGVFLELTPLPALSREGLVRALVEPAKRRGFGFEDEGLVEEMVSSVEGARGALPLLAFAISRLWERRDRERKLLTRAAYEEVGGVAGALAQHAEATMDRIGTERQALVREVFRNLVTAQGTRAVADREELLSVFPERKAAEEVLAELIDARLLTSFEVEGKEGEPSHHRIEIAHESLLKAWPRLVRWQAQDEEGAVLRDQLKQAAHLWEEKERTSDILWTGTAFAEYELWRGRYTGALTALEEDFARAMREKARRRRRLVRAAAVAAVLVSTGVAIAIAASRHQAVVARERAEAEARRAEASRLVALGKLELEVDPTLALAYARTSLGVEDSAEARRLVLEALWRGPVASVLPVLGAANEACIFPSMSPDDRWLACSNWGSRITLLSSDGKTTRVLANNRNAARLRIVRFSDDSKRLATFASGDPETVVWSVEGQEVERLRPGGYPRRFAGDDLLLFLEPGGDQRPMQAVTRRIGSPETHALVRLPPDGDWDLDLARGLLVRSKGRAILSVPFGAQPRVRGERLVGEHGAPVALVNIHDGTGWIVSLDERREVRIWDGETRRRLRTVQGLDPDRLFFAPILDTRGTRLAWQSMRERAFVVWDLAGPPDAEPLLLRKNEVVGDGGSATFTGDSRWLVAVLSTKVAFWPLQMPWPRVIRVGSTPRVAFTADSRQIVSCANDATGVYPLTPDAPPARTLSWESGFACYGLAIDPTGPRALLAATAQALLLAPLDGRPAEPLVRVPPTESICTVAADAAGRWAATAACYSPDPANRLLHVVDRHSGTAKAFPLPGSAGEAAYKGVVSGLRFVADGRLLAASAAGLHLWDVEAGANEVLDAAPCGPLAASGDGRRVVVGCNPDEPGRDAGAGNRRDVYPEPPFDLQVIDTTTGEHRTIESHGRDIAAIAVSPSGALLATGDTSGVVRVGRIDGSEPHLLVGGGGLVTSLAFSPDGRWLASASGKDLRLWPMPDVSKPPLHTLPLEALLAILDRLTNLRVIGDPAVPTGYRVETGPFPGWTDVPDW